MLPEDEKLAEICATMASTASAGADWIERNGGASPAEASVAVKELRRSAYAARKLEAAARRKMCVGVFGPSQSGKSFLISALARSGTERLMAEFDAEAVDFVKDINPEGGRESTGIVTRFTMDRPASLPAGNPVQVRLLSQTDLVKILGNTFFADCKQSSLEDPEPRDISAKLDALAAQAGEPTDALTEDDVLDCQEYFEKYFSSNSRVKVLRKAYWGRAAQLAPRLKPQARGQLFSLVWGEVEPFTRLFLQLLMALKALDFQGEVFCPLTALVPKKRSIIDVAMLAPIGSDDPDLLNVVTRTGKSVPLGRSIVTGLAAELVIVMQKKPYGFFDHTDLLDFPGARSREEIRDIGAQLEKPEGLKDFFLRGKVSYLFERYATNLELNTMLLCIGPSNQEVRGLPEIVKYWIDSTHGPTPEERAKKSDTSLFFVLTQFDKEFERKPDWKDTVSSRWSTRLFSSMLDFFGKYHSWPREWRPGRPFDNTYCLRNPNIDQPALFDYEDGREKNPRPDMVDYVNALAEGFVGNPDVQHHFADPHAAWNAVMKLNDGGVSLLAERLSPVCNPRLKREQIAGLAHEEARRILARLRPLFRSGDLEAERKKKIALAEGIARRLVACASAQTFGALLHRLHLDEQDVADICFALELTRPAATEEAEQAPAPAPVIGPAIGDDDLLASLGLAPEPEPTAQASNTRPPSNMGRLINRPMDEADRYALEIERYWISQVNDLSENVALGRLFSLPPTEFSQFVQELVTGAARLRLRDRIAAEIRSARAFHTNLRDKLIWRQAGPASVIVNTYLDHLGFGPGDSPPYRPTVKAGDGERTVFAVRPDITDYPPLRDTPTPYDRDFYLDWIKCFIQLAGDNADGGMDDGFNPAENEKLGGLIRSIEAVAA